MAVNTERSRYDETVNEYDIYRPGARRLVFGISNRKFSDEKLNRPQAATDNDYNVFSNYFGFECCSREGKDFVLNATKTTLEHELDYVKNILQREDVSCLAVILSSHGTETIVAGQREHFIQCSDGKLFRTLEIIKSCQTRKNIPVIFVIQACRFDMRNYQGDDSDKIDKGVLVVVVEEDSDADEDSPVDTRDSGDSNAGGIDSPVDTRDSGDSNAGGIGPSGYSSDARAIHPTKKQKMVGNEIEEIRSLMPACAPNMCVFFASSEGKYAYRDRKGGWLLFGLDKKVKNLKDKGTTEISLFDLFTGVNRELSAFGTLNQKSASCFLHQMPKKMMLKFQK